MQPILKFALRRGISKGFLGGSRPWLVIGGIAMGIRVLRKAAGSEPVVVYSEALRPGESVVIAHGREPR